MNDLMFGRVMPQAIDLEESVLGACLLDKNAFVKVIEGISEESFYLQSHQHIFGAMMSLFEALKPIDTLTVKNELEKKGKLKEVGGVMYLMDLMDKIGSSANVEYHAMILKQKYIQRKIIEVSTNSINEAFENEKDVLELLNDLEQSIYKINDSNLSGGFEKVKTVAPKVYAKIEQLSRRKESITGVPTGFKDMDKMTSGWQNSDLIILAARPGMGKTALTLCLAYNAAAANVPVGIFSLEMSTPQLVQRMVSMDSMIPAFRLKEGKLKNGEWEKLSESVDRVSDLPIFIDDTPALNIFEVRAKCRRLKQQHGVGMIVLDYLQLMNGAGGKKNREQEISTISRGLKSLAKELDIPVIALSQLSRAVETRGGDKKPQLSDLRESGAIEQDADIVTFIYRPEYYGLEEMEDEGLSEVIFSKNRHGSLGSVNLKFLKDNVKFVDPINDGGFIAPDHQDLSKVKIDYDDFEDPF